MRDITDPHIETNVAERIHRDTALLSCRYYEILEVLVADNEHLWWQYSAEKGKIIFTPPEQPFTVFKGMQITISCIAHESTGMSDVEICGYRQGKLVSHQQITVCVLAKDSSKDTYCDYITRWDADRMSVLEFEELAFILREASELA